jgi:Flp pilus assembly protein TadG
MRRIHQQLRRFRRSERGASAAEFAIVIPVFLMLVLTTINFGMFLYSLSDLHYTAQRTARCFAMASLNGVIGANTCLDDASSNYNGMITGVSFTHSAGACGNTVTGAGSFNILTGFASLPVNVSASGCYPLQ